MSFRRLIDRFIAALDALPTLRGVELQHEQATAHHAILATVLDEMGSNYPDGREWLDGIKTRALAKVAAASCPKFSPQAAARMRKGAAHCVETFFK